jgi:hypothetical protein
MDLIPVNSNALEAIGHDPTTNQLRVRFKSGHEYLYDGVPASVHEELLAAKSIGRTFQQKVVGGGYTHTKVTANGEGNGSSQTTND